MTTLFIIIILLLLSSLGKRNSSLRTLFFLPLVIFLVFWGGIIFIPLFLIFLLLGFFMGGKNKYRAQNNFNEEAYKKNTYSSYQRGNTKYYTNFEDFFKDFSSGNFSGSYGNSSQDFNDFFRDFNGQNYRQNNYQNYGSYYPNSKAEYMKVLGVTENMTREEIKKAYLKKVKEYHPDRLINASPEEKKRNEDKLKKINEAYDNLMKYNWWRKYVFKSNSLSCRQRYTYA